MSDASHPPYWDQAIKALSKRDATLKGIIRSYHGETMKARGDAFFTLARAITGQQISVKAADSIWGRLVGELGEVKPERLLATPPQRLRELGFSQQKIAYLRDIAEHFTDRARIAHWPELEDDALIAELVKLKGVGRWTAEMMLMFHYLRPDVFPIDDLGLLKAIYRHYNGGERMPKEAVLKLGETWRPWRSVATWYLWRALDPVPVEY
ncbi:MAG: DNA-3-methyladenine glycosylase 2 family protein [Alphaproteobacteria bacterium]|nr:DNA-3-methyladenine glycosylase 2 family protein [Alphaproteobacteria bacterium]